MAAGGDVAIIYIIAKTYKTFNLTIGEITAILLYVRTLQNNAGAITNNIQAVAKVFGASYEIGVLMVTPNQVVFKGDKRPDENNCGEELIQLQDCKFAYPSKPEVPILRGISIDVRKCNVVALVG